MQRHGAAAAATASATPAANAGAINRQAAAACEKALRALKPTDALAQIGLMHEVGDWPSHIVVYKALVYFMSDDVKQAEACLVVQVGRADFLTSILRLQAQLMLGLPPVHPFNAWVHYAIGHAYFAKRDFQQAYIEFNHAKEADPTNGDAALYAALSALEKGLLIEGIVLPDLNRALELKPILAREVYFWRGECYERLAKSQVSMNGLDNLCAYVPDDNQQVMLKYITEAISNFRMAAQLNPLRVLEKFPPPNKKRYPIQIDVTDPFATLCHGYASYYNGDMASADNDFRQVILCFTYIGSDKKTSIHPFIKREAWHWLHQCRIGDVENMRSAMTQFHCFVDRENMPAIVFALIQVQQAYIILKTSGELDKAEAKLKLALECAEKEVKSDADYPACWGLLEAMRAAPTKALEHLRIAYQLDPHNIAACEGLAYLSAEDAKKAQYRTAALERYPCNSEMRTQWQCMLIDSNADYPSVYARAAVDELLERVFSPSPSHYPSGIFSLALFSRCLFLEMLSQPMQLPLKIRDRSRAQRELACLLRVDPAFDNLRMRRAKLNVFLLLLCQKTSSAPTDILTDKTNVEIMELMAHWEQGVASMNPDDVYPDIRKALKVEVEKRPGFLPQLQQSYSPLKRFITDVFRAYPRDASVESEHAVEEATVVMPAAAVATSQPTSVFSSLWGGVDHFFSSAVRQFQEVPAITAAHIVATAVKLAQSGNSGAAFQEFKKLYDMDLGSATKALNNAMPFAIVGEDAKNIMRSLLSHQGIVLCLQQRFREAYTSFLLVDQEYADPIYKDGAFGLYRVHITLALANETSNLADKQQYWDEAAQHVLSFSEIWLSEACNKKILHTLWNNINGHPALLTYFVTRHAAAFRALQKQVVGVWRQELDVDAQQALAMLYGRWALNTIHYFSKFKGSNQQLPAMILVGRFLVFLMDKSNTSLGHTETAFKDMLQSSAPHLATMLIVAMEEISRSDSFNFVLQDTVLSKRLTVYCQQVPGFATQAAYRDVLYAQTNPSLAIIFNDQCREAYLYRYFNRLYAGAQKNDEQYADLAAALRLGDEEIVAALLLEAQAMRTGQVISRIDEVEPGANEFTFKQALRCMKARRFATAHTFFAIMVRNTAYRMQVGFYDHLATYLQCKSAPVAAVAARPAAMLPPRPATLSPEEVLLDNLAACVREEIALSNSTDVCADVQGQLEKMQGLLEELGAMSAALQAVFLSVRGKLECAIAKTEEADGYFKAATEADPNSVAAYEAYFNWLFTQREDSRIEAIAQQVFTRCKYDSSLVVDEVAHKWLGKVQARSYQPERELLPLTIEHAKTFFYRGVAYYEANNWRDARKYFDLAIGLDVTLKKKAAFYYAVAYGQLYARGQSNISDDLYNEICTYFYEAARLFPDEAHAYFSHNQPGFPAELLSRCVGFSHMFRGNSKMAVAYFINSYGYADRNPYPYQRAIALIDWSASYCDAGSYNVTIQLQSAIQESSSMFKAGPYTHLFYPSIAFMLTMDGRLQEAEAYYKRDTEGAHHSYFYLRQEDVKRAQDLLATQPKKVSIESALCEAYLALRANDIPTAIEGFDQVLTLSPGHVVAHLMRGRLLCTAGSTRDVKTAAADFAILLNSETNAHPRYVLATQIERYMHYKELPITGAQPTFAEADADKAFLQCINRYPTGHFVNADDFAICMLAHAAAKQYTEARNMGVKLLGEHNFFSIDLPFRYEVLKLFAEPWCGLTPSEQWLNPNGVPSHAAAATVGMTPQFGMGRGIGRVTLPWAPLLGFARPAAASTEGDDCKDDVELQPMSSLTRRQGLE